MKKYALLIICLFPYFSCSDSINDMLDELDVVDYPICVDRDCTDPSPDGNGWDRAYTTIAAAVNAANPGDTLWVKNGEYDNTTINKIVKIYGGFDASGRRSEDNYNTVIHGLTINGGAGSGTLIEGVTLDRASLVAGAGAAPTLNNCRIANVTDGRGLTVNEGFDNLVITNSTISNCSGGGIQIDDKTILASDSNVSISNSVFESNNTINVNGGAIEIYSGVSAAPHIIIAKCIFKGNTCTIGTGGGGAIYCSHGDIQITNSIFKDNFVTNTTTVNSALGGALLFTISAKSTVENSLFYNNKAVGSGTVSVRGGAVLLGGGTHTFINSTFCNNNVEAALTYFEGSAVCIFQGTANFYNTIFFGNGTSAKEIYVVSPAATIKLYSCYNSSSLVKNDGILDCVSGCIDSAVNPFMSTTPTDPYFLYPNSSSGVMNAGTVSSLPAGFVMPDVDLAGKPRVVGAGIDMGAYEWQ